MQHCPLSVQGWHFIFVSWLQRRLSCIRGPFLETDSVTAVHSWTQLAWWGFSISSNEKTEANGFRYGSVLCKKVSSDINKHILLTCLYTVVIILAGRIWRYRLKKVFRICREFLEGTVKWSVVTLATWTVTVPDKQSNYNVQCFLFLPERRGPLKAGLSKLVLAWSLSCPGLFVSWWMLSYRLKSRFVSKPFFPAVPLLSFLFLSIFFFLFFWNLCTGFFCFVQVAFETFSFQI